MRKDDSYVEFDQVEKKRAAMLQLVAEFQLVLLVAQRQLNKISVAKKQLSVAKFGRKTLGNLIAQKLC